MNLTACYSYIYLHSCSTGRRLSTTCDKQFKTHANSQISLFSWGTQLTSFTKLMTFGDIYQR